MGTKAPTGNIHEPVETDFELLVDYLMGYLSPQREKLVEARLVEDEAFFRMFLPLTRKLDADPTPDLTILRAIFMQGTTSTPSSERKMRSAPRNGTSAATPGAGGSSSGQLDFPINRRGIMDTNGAAADRDDPFEPIDPDFALLIDYTTGNLSPEQEAVVEERLVDDEAFFKMWVPVAQIHNAMLNTKWESGFVPPPLPAKWHEPH